MIGPSTIAFARPADGGGVDVEAVDLAAGTREKLGHHANAADTLLDARRGQLTFVSGASRIVTVLSDRPPVVVDLPPVGN